MFQIVFAMLASVDLLSWERSVDQTASTGLSHSRTKNNVDPCRQL